MAEDLPNYLPGFEPEKVQTLLQTFFNEVNKDFPNKKIVWAEWNHSKFDKAADYLCKCLGYSSTANFLNAYGYEVLDTVFIDDVAEKTLSVDSNAAKKDKENAFPVYSLAITITTIVASIFLWLSDGVINDDAVSYAAVGLLLLIVLCVVGFSIAAIRLLIMKKKRYSARKTKKKLVIYLVGIIVFAYLCGISEVWESPLIREDGTIIFTNTISPYKVNDVNDRINQIIKENNSSFAELCDLYSEYDNSRNDEARLKKLKSNIHNFFRSYANGAKACNGDIMWTCFGDYENRVKGSGYTCVRTMSEQERALPQAERDELEKRLTCFVPCNAKATNIYRDRWALAYCVNMYFNPMIRRFFTDGNEDRARTGQDEIYPDENMYALSCLIQWIFRSRIRDGQPIYLYIPNKRMRKLLFDWMDSKDV